MYEGLIVDGGSVIIAIIFLFTEIRILNQKLHNDADSNVQNDDKA